MGEATKIGMRNSNAKCRSLGTSSSCSDNEPHVRSFSWCRTTPEHHHCCRDKVSKIFLLLSTLQSGKTGEINNEILLCAEKRNTELSPQRQLCLDFSSFFQASQGLHQLIKPPPLRFNCSLTSFYFLFQEVIAQQLGLLQTPLVLVFAVSQICLLLIFTKIKKKRKKQRPFRTIV